MHAHNSPAVSPSVPLLHATDKWPLDLTDTTPNHMPNDKWPADKWPSDKWPVA